jgi:hypothetical protein
MVTSACPYPGDASVLLVIVDSPSGELKEAPDGFELREAGGGIMCSTAHFQIHNVTNSNTLQTRSTF